MNIIFFGDSLTKGRPALSIIDLLQHKLPAHTLINLGKNGDTVKSLYYRIQKTKITNDVDIVFLWIGTNDVLVHLFKSSALFKTLMNQPWTNTLTEFRTYYQKILEILSTKTKKICTIPPVFIGEDPDNQWNKKLKELSTIIRNVSDAFSNTMFIDLQAEFMKHTQKTTSSYLPKTSIIPFLDGLQNRTVEKIDALSTSRGLQFTFDGVHLNSKGTQIVASAFFQAIQNIEKKSK